MGFLNGLPKHLIPFRRVYLGLAICSTDLLFYSTELTIELDAEGKQFYKNDYNPVPTNRIINEDTGNYLINEDTGNYLILD